MGWVTLAGALSGTLKQALSKRSLSHFLGSPRPGRCQWERGQAGAGRTRVFSPCSLCWGGWWCEPTALPACPRAHQAAPGFLSHALVHASTQPPQGTLYHTHHPPASSSPIVSVLLRGFPSPRPSSPRLAPRAWEGWHCTRVSGSCHRQESSQPACACLFSSHSQSKAEDGKELAVSPVSGNCKNSCFPS